MPADTPYTDDDVRIVAQALWDGSRDEFPHLPKQPSATCREEARAVLDALAAAGRLLPADALADRVEQVMRAESDRISAPGDARSIEQGIGAMKAANAVLRAIRGAGPWVPAPEETPQQPEEDR